MLPIATLMRAAVATEVIARAPLSRPKLVLTAAHCLFHEKQSEPPGNVRFLAGLNKGIPAAYSVAERLVVSQEFEPGHIGR